MSLAHCARLTERAAEVGVQTDDGNTASHRVAAKCGAEPLGVLSRLAVAG